MAWKKGDKVRHKLTGEVVEVYAYKPEERTYREDIKRKFLIADKGFTYIDDKDFERWGLIENYELISADDAEQNEDAEKFMRLIEKLGEALNILADYDSEEAEEQDVDGIADLEHPARVGDMIRIARPCGAFGLYDAGDELYVSKVDEDGDVRESVNANTGKVVEHYIASGEYDIIYRTDDPVKLSYIKAGRVPYDLQGRDIVKTVELRRIAEVDYAPIGKTVRLDKGSEYADIYNLELICPAEARVDYV